jgi:hypothetical protein
MAAGIDIRDVRRAATNTVSSVMIVPALNARATEAG